MEPISLSGADKSQLEGLLRDIFFDGNPQQFMRRVLQYSPREKDLIGRPHYQFSTPDLATEIVGIFCKFGTDLPGRHVLVLLIDEIKRTLGTQQGDALDQMVRTYCLTGSFDAAELDKSGIRNNYQSWVNKQLDIADFGKWTRDLAQIGQRVCKLQTPRGGGTGFLVGKDLILTNYHVIAGLLTGIYNANAVTVVFEHQSNGTPETHRLNSDWRVFDSEPDHAADKTPSRSSPASPDLLDFALLRLAAAPGETRGWISAAADRHDFDADRALYIVQHPMDCPLSLAVDTDAIIETNPNRSRVRYRTNTKPGSSGSPCFDRHWRWVALHHSGDLGADPQWNEGVPVDAIRDLLARRGRSDLLPDA
jgi:V8-like Glu-specific endopeptidase